MKTVVITCRTVEEELTEALRRTGSDAEVIWLESGLHNVKRQLHDRMQEELDRIEADRVLLAMGTCGNAYQGVKTGKYETILPRVDDCITLLLGSVSRRIQISRELAAYFFSEGWLKGERNLWVEYQHMVEKYGEEEAEVIAGMMYGHYRTLGILDCGFSDPQSMLERTKVIADTLHLEQKLIPASVDLLCRLLSGPWDDAERFLVIPPESEITGEMLLLPGGGAGLQ